MRTIELANYIAREAIRIGFTHIMPIRHTQTTESKYLTLVYNPGTKSDDPKLRLTLRISEHAPSLRSFGWDIEVRNKQDAGKQAVKLLKQKLENAKSS